VASQAAGHDTPYGVRFMATANELREMQARNMKRELMEWRQRKAVASTEDNASKCLWRVSGRGTVLGKENALCTYADSHRKAFDPSTPSKSCKRPVAAESPLMEVCQNGSRVNYSDRVQRRPRPARVREPTHSCGFTFIIESADMAWQEKRKDLEQLKAPPSSPVAARTLAQARVEQDAEQDPELIPYLLAAALATIAPAEELPRSGVATDRLSSQLGDTRFTVFDDEIEEPHRHLESDYAAAGTSLRDFLPAENVAVDAHRDQEDLMQLITHVQEEVHEEDVQEETSEAEDPDEDEHAAFCRRIRKHRLVAWGPPVVLDMEDWLSRAYDLSCFWFFESRDRIDNALRDEFEKLEERPGCIHEYPPGWPQWRIEQFEREASQNDQPDRLQSGPAGATVVEDAEEPEPEAQS